MNKPVLLSPLLSSLLMLTLLSMAAPDMAMSIDCSMPVGTALFERPAVQAPSSPRVPRRGRPFVHRCRCGDPACAVLVANRVANSQEAAHATA